MIERRHRGEGGNGLRTLKNVLNTLFVVGAIAGLLWYFFKDRQEGTIVILCSMVPKMIEVVLRLMRL